MTLAKVGLGSGRVGFGRVEKTPKSRGPVFFAQKFQKPVIFYLIFFIRPCIKNTTLIICCLQYELFDCVPMVLPDYRMMLVGWVGTRMLEMSRVGS